MEVGVGWGVVDGGVRWEWEQLRMGLRAQMCTLQDEGRSAVGEVCAPYQGMLHLLAASASLSLLSHDQLATVGSPVDLCL